MLQKRLMPKTLTGFAVLSFLLSIATLPFSTATVNIFIALAVVLSLFSKELRTRLKTSWRNPFAIASLTFFMVFLIGILYPGVPWKEAYLGVHPYRKLLFVPIFIALFSIADTKDKALKLFALSMVFTLCASYLHVVWPFAWADGSRRGESWDHTIFKHHLLQNLFMTFLAVLWVRFHGFRPGGFKSWIFWLGLAVICFNIWVLVDGRTGHLTLAGILLWMVWHFSPKRLRFLMISGAIAFTIALGAYLVNNQSRFSKIGEEIRMFQDGKLETSSSGQRLEFWKQSWSAIKERPVLGWGTGSYSGQYCLRGASAFSCKVGSYNPHNQYIFIAVQFGFVGLFGYLGFLGFLFWKAHALPDKDKVLAVPLLIMLSIHSMFDAPLFVVAEGHFYAIMLGLAFSSWAEPKST
jgi:O-antigen ligase